MLAPVAGSSPLKAVQIGLPVPKTDGSEWTVDEGEEARGLAGVVAPGVGAGRAATHIAIRSRSESA